MGVAALTGLALAGGVPSVAQAKVDNHGQDIGIMNFWFHHSTYDSHEDCEAAAQKLLWPANPGGADDYECRDHTHGADLWLMFLS